MPGPARPRLQLPGLIVCEGRDDERFLVAMLGALNLTNIWVEYVEGVSEIAPYILALRRRPGFDRVRAVGIVRDADENAAIALASVRGALSAAEWPLPHRHGEVRAIDYEGATRHVGAFIMPNGAGPGELEDLCLDAIRAERGPEGLACVEEFLTCVTAQTGVACKPGDHSKARLNAWLSSRSDPTLRLGQAISAGEIPPNAPPFGPIRTFLEELATAAQAPAS